MTQSVTSHPDPKKLEAFALGQLDASETSIIEEHVSLCASCCEQLGSVRGDTLVGLAREAYQASFVVDSGLANQDTTDEEESTGDRTSPLQGIPQELLEHPRYRLVAVLGTGGMGTVFKAEHRIMNRTVALKVIKAEFMSHPTAVGRFHREVQAAARLTHPNIVTAYDAEQAGNLHFLVMEHVKGVSLAHLVQRKGPMTVNLACHFVRQAALGLQHAHEQGMVHRDIKPHNLMVTKKGQVKILDFGLARLADEERSATLHSIAELVSSGSMHEATESLTKVGTVVGTPDYLAPEQARNSRDVDIRADLYSLGCTLYYLLTGSAPFPTGSAIEKLFKHCEEPIPEPTGVPAEVLTILNKLMAKKADDRYQTPAEVVSDLAPFAKEASGEDLKSLAIPASKKKKVPAARTSTLKRPKDTLPGFVENKENSATPIVANSPEPSTRSKPASLPKRNWMIAGIVGVGLLVGIVIGISLLGGSGNETLPKPPANENNKNSPIVNKKKSPAQGRKVLFVLPSQGLWGPDYYPVREVLEENGVIVETASTTKTVMPHLNNPPEYERPFSVDRVIDGNFNKESNYDLVVFVGFDVDEYLYDKEVRKQVEGLAHRMMKEKNQYVTSICAGQKVLAHYGLLKYKKVAENKEFSRNNWMKDYHLQKYIKWSDEPVVQEGSLITASGFEHAAEFSQKLIDVLATISIK